MNAKSSKPIRFSLITLLLVLFSTVSALKVVIDSEKEGSFYIIHGVDNQTLFQGSQLAVFVGGKWCVAGNHSNANTLESVGTLQERRGEDETLGPFTAWTRELKCRTSSSQHSVRIVTSVYNYDSDVDVVFTISYPDGAEGTETGSWTKSMAHWPAFRASSLPSAMSWQGTFMNPVNQVSQGPNGGPVVFYNSSDEELSTVIVASVWNGNWKPFSSGDGLDWDGKPVLWAPGTSGRIEELPKGYQQSVLLHSSSGMTNAIYEWGQAVQRSRPTRGRKIRDVTLQTLGYQTDNGAYYCFCNDSNCSQTLIDEIHYLKSISIPMGYLSFQGAGASSGRGTAAPWCVDTWGIDGGLSSRYPVSVKDMQKAIGIPLQLYAPYFCPESAYFNATSKWNKVSSNSSLPSCSMFDFENVSPEQSRAFYDEFFDRGIQAGMMSYESDFMNQNFNCVPEFMTTSHAALMWQHGMANAAAARNISIQWCMATPSDALASVDMPAVTNLRVSTDFCYGDSWEIGVSSLLVWALGSAPSKDTLWTTNNNKTAIPGCSWTPDHEALSAELHVILALMSTGPVGISDAHGMTNATLLKRAIRSDGALLKPAKSITAIDSSFLDSSKAGLQGYIYGTAGYIGRAWHFVSFKMKEPYSVRMRDFWPPIASSKTNDDIILAYRDFHRSPLCKHGSDAITTGCVKLVHVNDKDDQSTEIFIAPRSSFSHVTQGSDFFPTLTTVWRSCYPKNDWIFMGELDKYVPLSPIRFINIGCIEAGVAVELKGLSGEEIKLTSVDANMKVVVHKVVIPKSGSTVISLRKQGVVDVK